MLPNKGINPREVVTFQNEINAFATPKKLLRTGRRAQNTNNDPAIVPKPMGQAKKFDHFDHSSQCP